MVLSGAFGFGGHAVGISTVCGMGVDVFAFLSGREWRGFGCFVSVDSRYGSMSSKPPAI